MKSISKLIIGIILLAVINANAQKKPSFQQVSVWAPDNIKIDGKLNEWGDKELKAYNSESRIFYVISNDDNNLYLTVCGLGTRVASKSLVGGMTFTVSYSSDKKTRETAIDNVLITFPIPQDLKTWGKIIAPQLGIGRFLRDTLANKMKIDSIVSASNRQLDLAIKEIKVSGIPEIKDSLISLTNIEGIRARMQFWTTEPVYELAIPLKYLRLSLNNLAKFSYNIKLNGSRSSTPTAANDNTDPNTLYAENSTDFWGEYTLARKP